MELCVTHSPTMLRLIKMYKEAYSCKTIIELDPFQVFRQQSLDISRIRRIGLTPVDFIKYYGSWASTSAKQLLTPTAEQKCVDGIIWNLKSNKNHIQQ